MIEPHELEAEQVRLAALKRMSDADKWNEFRKMRRLAWELKMAAVRMQHPDWDEARVHEQVRQIFLYATT